MKAHARYVKSASVLARALTLITQRTGLAGLRAITLEAIGVGFIVRCDNHTLRRAVTRERVPSPQKARFHQADMHRGASDAR